MLFASLALAGCAQTAQQKNLTAQDLENHRFVLQSVNGATFIASENGKVPGIDFGKNLEVSGSMCNRFMGQATLQDNRLKAEGLAMTRMICNDQQLDSLDNQLNEMLQQGAQVTFIGQQLTLKGDKTTLVYMMTNAQ